MIASMTALAAVHKIARLPGHAIPVGPSRVDTSGGVPPLAQTISNWRKSYGN